MNKIDTITIPKAEYVDLLVAQATLDRLECGGVDNWGYYGEALYPEGEISIEELAAALAESLINQHDETNVGLTYKILPNAGIPLDKFSADNYNGIEIFVDGEYIASLTGFVDEEMIRELLNGKGQEI